MPHTSKINIEGVSKISTKNIAVQVYLHLCLWKWHNKPSTFYWLVEGFWYHNTPLKRLCDIGLSTEDISWLSDYLSGRMQSVHFAGLSPSFLPVKKGLPQGSVLCALLYWIHMNDLCYKVLNASFEFCAEDFVIYCSCTTWTSLAFLQSAFNILQTYLAQIKLVLNKTFFHIVFTDLISVGLYYRCLGIITDQSVS